MSNSPVELDQLKRSEEAKRERCWNAAERWRVLQETIAWIDAQQAVPRNSPAGCLAEQRRLTVSQRFTHATN